MLTMGSISVYYVNGLTNELFQEVAHLTPVILTISGLPNFNLYHSRPIFMSIALSSVSLVYFHFEALSILFT